MISKVIAARNVPFRRPTIISQFTRSFAVKPKVSGASAPFQYQPLFESNGSKDRTPFRKLTSDYVRSVDVNGTKYLQIDNEGISLLAKAAMEDVAHLLRHAHLQQLSNILGDPEASDNDKFVALTLLKNANIASAKILPGCQDTGTAIVLGKRGHQVLTSGNDEEALSRGVYDTYQTRNLRFSQLAPLDMFTEINTKNNLPAQIDIYSKPGNQYDFQFVMKGGGSANKTFLHQGTPNLLSSESMLHEFLQEKIDALGTAACPPYHLSVVIGGLSAEQNLKTVKLASTKYYDDLPTSGNDFGRAFRDLKWEKKIEESCRAAGIGAQFGGKYFVHDVRVVRLPRHGASLPIGIGVSCSADRQALGYISEDGIFLEQLETDPAKYLPDVSDELSYEEVKIDLNQPMNLLLSTLTQYPIKTRLSLSGTIIVARDLAHLRLKQRLEKGEGLPDYIKNHVVLYAGPAKTPAGYAAGAFGPTTAGRMDSYVDLFQKNGGSMIMLAKGNRSRRVTKACKDNGGFYLGSIGGAAADVAEHRILKMECVEFEELGMEAVWKIEVENFPAFIVVDDKGNDFFAKWSH